MALDRLTQITSSGISSTSTITVSAVAGSITGVVTATSLSVTGSVTTGLDVSGIVTATTVQVGSATTIHTTGIDLGSGNITSHNINSTGIITSTSFVGPVTGNVTGDLTGNVSSSGANTLGSLTVTNDATVGGALTVTGDLTVNGTTTTIDTAVTAVDSLAIDGDASVGGALTATGNITANAFYGDGSNLTGIDATQIVTGNTSVQTVDTGSDGHVKVNTEGSERLRISSTGLVGIGTDNPQQKLHIVDNTSANIYIETKNQTTGSTAGIYFKTSETGIDNFFKSAIVLEDDGTSWARGKLHILQDNTADDSNATLSDSVVTIDQSGNVGIGTDNPSQTLDVNGNIIIRKSNNLYFETTSGFAPRLTNSADQNSLSIFANNTERLRITSGGNVRVPDNGKFTCGASDDIQIFHNGTNSAIQASGTGDLYIDQLRDDGDIYLRSDNGAGAVTNYIHCDGSTGEVKLDYYGSNKLRTTSTGINVTGSVTCDGLTVDGTFTQSNGTGLLAIKDNNNTGNTVSSYVQGQDSAGTEIWKIGQPSTGNSELYLWNNTNGAIRFGTSNNTRAYLDADGHFIPAADDTYDLGLSGLQWRNGYFDGTVHCDGINIAGNGALTGGDLTIGSSTDTSVFTRLDFEDSGGIGFFNLNAHGTADFKFLHNRTGSTNTGIPNSSGGIATNYAVPIYFANNATARAYFDTNGHFRPAANNTYDLGASSERWRNIYTNDLNLSNEGSTNDVDGTWGNYTIQEGEDDLFLINRRSGKKYKFMLQEVN